MNDITLALLGDHEAAKRVTASEAIEILERKTTIPGDGYTFEQINEALDLALAALRGPTREMVERMRGEWEWLGPCRDNKGVSWGTCSVCKTRQRLGDRLSFCPACGAPMTGEAVQMVMERLEALKDGKGD